ncbi:MAG: phosphoadenosine phosphosulfate reductase family protein [Desulfovibrio sp.]|nr:phosphoadenosine phosphosulfate reductase family protein [Desulfovibrio sp.]
MDAATRTQHWALSLAEKCSLAKQYILEALANAPSRVALGWTGGKDSTVLLWLTREVCHEANLPMPQCVYIDDGDVFPEIDFFVRSTTSAWGLDVAIIRNEDLLFRQPRIGEAIDVTALSSTNQLQLQAIGYHDSVFYFEPESFAGSHLTKTVPLLQYLSQHFISHFLVGIRWDEQEQRLGEEFNSLRDNPPHTRVHPILHFRERDIWDLIHGERLPFCELYRQGYRSLGARSTTRPLAAVPAWEQDLEHTSERQGRGQDKEAVMEQLRSLGYM